MKRLLAILLIGTLAACAPRDGWNRPAPSAPPSAPVSVSAVAQESAAPAKEESEWLIFADDVETQKYVCELASLFGGERFASPKEIDPLLLARTCAMKLYSLGEATEGDDGWCTIPKDALGDYLSAYFGVDVEDCIPAATAPSLEYLRDARAFRFYPAGDGGRYSAAIHDIQIKDGEIVYALTLTDGFDPALQKEILLSFSVEQEDGGGFCLRLQANQVQQAAEPTAAQLLKNGLGFIRDAQETGRIEIAVDVSSEQTEALSSRTPTWDDAIVQIDNARKIGHSYRPTVDRVLHENALYQKFSSAAEWGGTEPKGKLCGGQTRVFRTVRLFSAATGRRGAFTICPDGGYRHPHHPLCAGLHPRAVLSALAVL